VAGLLKARKQTKNKIRKRKEALELKPDPFDLELFRLSVTLINNDRRLMVSCYGSEAARKLPFEDVELFFKHDQTRALSSKEGPGSNLSEKELSTKVEELKTQEMAAQRKYRLEDLSPQEFNLLVDRGFLSKIDADTTSGELKKIAKLLVDIDKLDESLKKLIEEKNSLDEDEVFFKNYELENARKSRDKILGQLIQIKSDLSDDVMENVPLEDLGLIINEKWEIALNSESTTGEPQELVKTLKEQKEKISKQEKSTRVIEEQLFKELDPLDDELQDLMVFEKDSPELRGRLLLPDEMTEQKALSDKVEQLTKDEINKLWDEFPYENTPVKEKDLPEPMLRSPSDELKAVKESIDDIHNELLMHDINDTPYFQKTEKRLEDLITRKKELEKQIEIKKNIDEEWNKY
jgi:hypothetical protein